MFTVCLITKLPHVLGHKGPGIRRRVRLTWIRSFKQFKLLSKSCLYQICKEHSYFSMASWVQIFSPLFHWCRMVRLLIHKLFYIDHHTNMMLSHCISCLCHSFLAVSHVKHKFIWSSDMKANNLNEHVQCFAVVETVPIAICQRKENKRRNPLSPFNFTPLVWRTEFLTHKFTWQSAIKLVSSHELSIVGTTGY